MFIPQFKLEMCVLRTKMNVYGIDLEEQFEVRLGKASAL